MRVAIDAVAAGEAAGVVSAGNTGALLALAKIVIKTLSGIDRPAMAAIAPSVRGDVVMLDLGANVVCDSRNLVEFAVMGDVFARTVLGLTAPIVGLLNVGSRGGEGRRPHARRRRRAAREPFGPQFHGFVEGHDIAAGTTDVVVTDGFTGNVALKTAEGTAKLIMQLLRQAFTASLSAKLGYLLARSELERLRELVDPRRYNGAVMVGLNGVVVKSHGGTDGPGFAHAVDVAMDMVVHQLQRPHPRGAVAGSGRGCRRRSGRTAGPQRADGSGTEEWIRRRTRAATALPRPLRSGLVRPRRRAGRRSAAICPNGGDQRRARRTGRYLRRLDPRADRHPPAPHRRAARDLRLHGGARRAGRPGRRRRRGRAEVDAIILAHRHARPGLPGRAPGCRRHSAPAASPSTSRRRAAASSTRCRWPTR